METMKIRYAHKRLSGRLFLLKLETLSEIFPTRPLRLAKIRELVLELAVKGDWSERRTSDQDGATWREFVTKFDQRGCDSGAASSPPFEVPVKWP